MSAAQTPRAGDSLSKIDAHPFGEISVRSGHTGDPVLTAADLPVPDDLGPRGAALWRSTVEGLEFRGDEVALLTEMARTLDEVDALREAIREGGLTVAGSKGQPRPNPLLASLHASRALLIRLAQQLALPDPEEEVGQTEASKRAQHAARQRWKDHEKVTRESRHAAP